MVERSDRNTCHLWVLDRTTRMAERTITSRAGGRIFAVVYLPEANDVLVLRDLI